MFTKYKKFTELSSKLGIQCDGKAHIICIHLVTGADLIHLTLQWDRIVKENPQMFDQYKGLLAENIWDSTKKVETSINKVLLHQKVYINFRNNLQDIFSMNGVANITVQIHETNGKLLGHVVTLWKNSDIFFIHDNNINHIKELNSQEVDQLINSHLELESNYLLSRDIRFPIEGIFRLKE